MPTDAELTFADHMGRFYARRYSFPPMVGRLIGYLAVCDPPDPTIGELADALLASRSAIAGAVKSLETLHVVQRSRVAGERRDRVRIDISRRSRWGWTSPSTRSCWSWRARASMSSGTPRRSGVPCSWRCRRSPSSCSSEIPKFQQEWEARRQALVASGDLPEMRPGQRRRP